MSELFAIELLRVSLIWTARGNVPDQSHVIITILNVRPRTIVTQSTQGPPSRCWWLWKVYKVTHRTALFGG